MENSNHFLPRYSRFDGYRARRATTTAATVARWRIHLQTLVITLSILFDQPVRVRVHQHVLFNNILQLGIDVSTGSGLFELNRIVEHRPTAAKQLKLELGTIIRVDACL